MACEVTSKRWSFAGAVKRACRGKVTWRRGGVIRDTGSAWSTTRAVSPSPTHCARRSSTTLRVPDGKDGGTIIVGPHEFHDCLVAYDPAYVEVRAQELDAHQREHTAADGAYDYNFQRKTMAGEAVPFDGSGRFIMPAFPRFHANIDAHAFFLGINNRIEIWDPATALADASLDATVKKMIRFYMAEKGVRL